MIIGGFHARTGASLLPVAAHRLAPDSGFWSIGSDAGQVRLAGAGARRALVIGVCGAGNRQLKEIARLGAPRDAAWRWPGAYAIVLENPESVVIHTDPAGACPIYTARHGGGWAWSTSARVLAALTGGGIDIQRLAAAVFLPSIPALSRERTYFTGIRQAPPGARLTLPADSGAASHEELWRPEPYPGDAPARLRSALEEAVALRTGEAGLACDLSGGLDSSSLALLAAARLPAGKALDAVTVHPRGRLDGADLRYARAAAATCPGGIRHHLLPLGPEHLPYTAITTVPATDEPIPSTLTQARLGAQLAWMHETLGTRAHLTGDGGDSVLFTPPIHLADLIRHGRHRRAVIEAAGWARLREIGLGQLLRDARAAARTSRAQALGELAETLDAPGGERASDVRHFPLIPHPPWGRPLAAEHLRTAAREAAHRPDTPGDLDGATHTLIDEVREIARSAAADAALAEGFGIGLHNPFLDPSVVHAVFTVPIEERAPLHSYKPLLKAALADLLPPELAARSTKGSFNADHYTGMRANLPALLELSEGHLAAYGLIDPPGFRRHLRQAAAGVPMPLATIEQALTAEAWLTAHHRDPLPAWHAEPERSNSA